MLGNLIKHEFRATSRIVPLFYLAVIAIAVPTMIFNAMNYAVMSMVFATLLILVGTMLTYGTVIYLVIRFYKGVYGPEGYLTMTLPASENQILLSRGIVASAWILLSSVCFTATFYYAFQTLLYNSQESAEEIIMAMNMFSGGFMWFLMISMIIGNLAFLAETYMCVTIAHVRPFRKLGLGAAVLCYIIIYFVQQVVSLPLTIFVPFSINYTPDTGWSLTNTAMFNSMGEMFSQTVPDNYINVNVANITPADTHLDLTIGVAAMFLPIVMLIVCSAVTVWLTKKKINIR